MAERQARTHLVRRWSQGNTIGEYTTAGATVNASFITGLKVPDGLAVSGSDLFTTQLLPEPSTFVMLAIGGAALAACGIRRRRAVAGTGA